MLAKVKPFLFWDDGGAVDLPGEGGEDQASGKGKAMTDCSSTELGTAGLGKVSGRQLEMQV